MKKGPWTTTEDEMLREYVKKHGEGNWISVSKNTGLARSGKSCRLRWANHLRPNLKKGPFSQDEQDKIIYLHSKFGNKWSRIAAALPGRTDNEVKNFWNGRTKRCFNTGTPLYPPSLQPINNVHPPPPPSSLQNSTHFPHLSTAQLAANLQDLLSTLGSPYGPSLSLPPLSTLINIPPPAPPSPDSAFAIHDCYQPDNGLLEDLLGEAPALPHDEDSTIPIIDLSDDQMDDSLSLPLSTGVKRASNEDEVGKEDDLLGLLDSFSSEMPMLDWNGGQGQSSTLAGPNNAQ